MLAAALPCNSDDHWPDKSRLDSKLVSNRDMVTKIKRPKYVANKETGT